MLRVSPDGKEVWVQTAEANTNVVLDASDLTVLSTEPTGKQPVTNAWTRDRRYAVVTNGQDTFAQIFDARTFKEVKRLTIGQGGSNWVQQGRQDGVHCGARCERRCRDRHREAGAGGPDQGGDGASGPDRSLIAGEEGAWPIVSTATGEPGSHRARNCGALPVRVTPVAKFRY